MSNHIPSLVDELTWRGLLYQQTEGAAEALAAGPVVAYAGFDPTAASLHVGSLVPIMGLVHLQRAGHRPVALVGGGTGMIGDPSGRSAERALMDTETIAANVAGLRRQLERFLDFDDRTGARLMDNAEWLTKLGAIDFMRDVGKHFSVNVMLAKESVRARMDVGISYTEFSYMLLQAYDFLELNRRAGVTFQIGGSDQWGNIIAGIDLIRRTTGSVAHGITLPLVTSASGAKFGKSEGGGNVWLDPELTSPYRMYQFWVNADDRDLSRWLRFFTLLGPDEVRELEDDAAAHPEARRAQRALAADVTARVHGADAARVAAEMSELLFGRADVRSLSRDALSALSREVPSARASRETPLLDLVVQAGLVDSKGAARRLLQQGGLSIAGRKFASDETQIADADLLFGEYALLRRGARDWAVVQLTR